MSEEKGWSRQTLEATHGRAVQFLRGAGTSPVIRALLQAKGYTEEAHAEGWNLVLAAGGYQPTPTPVQAAAPSGSREAMLTVDAWDEPAHRLIRASWKRRYPDQLAFLLEGLAPATGMAAVAGVSTLLDRFGEMEKGEGRKGSHKQDLAALELLAQRGLTSDERSRMRELVARAQQGEAPAPGAPPEDQKKQVEREQAHADALVALRHWYEEWSEIARIAITRRDHLIRLGLAKRKARKTEPLAPPEAGKAPPCRPAACSPRSEPCCAPRRLTERKTGPAARPEGLSNGTKGRNFASTAPTEGPRGPESGLTGRCHRSTSAARVGQALASAGGVSARSSSRRGPRACPGCSRYRGRWACCRRRRCR